MFLLFLYEQHSIPTLAEAKRNVYIVYMREGQQHDRSFFWNILKFSLSTWKVCQDKLKYLSPNQLFDMGLCSKEASAEAMVYSYKHGFTGFAAKLTGTQARIISELPTVVQVIPNSFYKLQTTRSWDYLQLNSYSPKNILHKSQMSDGAIIGILDTGIWPESEVFRDEGLGPSVELFDARKTCNRKLIGARYFIEGLHAEYEKPFNISEYQDYLSPRDSIGHGTHICNCRLAMYKVCWNLYEEGICASVDMLKAFDKAIHDGVDVISLSIVLVCHCPSALTIANTAPWVITVAASTIDRSFPTRISLGNNWITMGQAIFTGQGTGFANLLYPEVSELLTSRYWESLSPNDTWSAGNVVLCFTAGSDQSAVKDAPRSVKEIGCLGLIIVENPQNSLYSCEDNFPSVQVMIRPSKTHVGRPVSTRGPSSVAPAILKIENVAAPGVNILATVPPSRGVAFEIQSGTSIATPHVSGIVDLLKSLHPDWSTAVIKSAIVTAGEPMKLADTFDYGGGIVNGNRAADPGLPSILNLNFPSITIPTLRNSTTFTRTVTNVGAVYSRYVAQAISFTVTVSSTHKVTTGYSFGSLTWSDGVHSVRSPISVRTEIIESYYYWEKWIQGNHES
ncbi:hypothetical protein I3843_05G183600 [Carya illinoinensis]|uniref:Uncharacterized protein n=1 Tax=Carya illinoinensis TaxID=32201 RepID=A0A922JRM5_CARIL|nr:hypothetical protein I3842_05G199400 [Carya illinoinensis]KAG7980461.1 hypothetical protein I3843_05G183600 [Carya illinoinensis]